MAHAQGYGGQRFFLVLGYGVQGARGLAHGRVLHGAQVQRDVRVLHGVRVRHNVQVLRDGLAQRDVLAIHMCGVRVRGVLVLRMFSGVLGCSGV